MYANTVSYIDLDRSLRLLLFTILNKIIISDHLVSSKRRNLKTYVKNNLRN